MARAARIDRQADRWARLPLAHHVTLEPSPLFVKLDRMRVDMDRTAAWRGLAWQPSVSARPCSAVDGGCVPSEARAKRHMTQKR